jgi:HEPN domain-containing protein
MANANIKIPKDHDLIKLYFTIESFIDILEDELVKLRIATNYYKEDRYSNPHYCLPIREEIKEVLDFKEKLFENVCKTLYINMEKVKI